MVATPRDGARGSSRAGRATKVDGTGRFFEATLLRDVPDDARLMRAESFGPVLPVAKVTGDDEALARMNDSTLGLTASVWTRDTARASRIAAQLEVGTVYMNRCDALDPALPWSGVKDSGCGVSLSTLGFDELTRAKALNFRFRSDDDGRMTTPTTEAGGRSRPELPRIVQVGDPVLRAVATRVSPDELVLPEFRSLVDDDDRRHACGTRRRACRTADRRAPAGRSWWRTARSSSRGSTSRRGRRASVCRFRSR